MFINNKDELVLVHIANVLNRSFSSKLDAAVDQLLKEIRSDREQIYNLRDDVTELTSIITTSASTIFNKHASSNPRTKEIHKKLCLLHPLFNDQFLLKVVPLFVIGFFVTNINEGSTYQSLEARGIELFATLYFSKQPSERKREKF